MKPVKKREVGKAERQSPAPTVVIRRSTPKEQRQQEAALDVLLAEWVRRQLGRRNNV